MWRILRGCVKIRIEGLSLEKFLNVCDANGILVWGVNRQAHCDMTVWMYPEDFKRLRGLIGGLRVHLLDKRGLPFLLWKLRRRPVLLVGLVFCLAGLILVSGRVWSINVKGAQRLGEKAVLEALEDVAAVGMPISGLDLVNLGNAIELKNPSIAWAGAQLNGVKLTITVVEKQVTPAAASETPCDIVAAKAGMIEKLTVLSGVAMKKQGDTVAAGDVIISGFMAGGQDGVDRYVRAAGEVVGKSWYTGEAYVNPQAPSQGLTGRSEEAVAIRLGTAEMFPPSAFEKYEEYKVDGASIDYLYIPLGISRIIRREIGQTTRQLSMPELTELAQEQAYKSATAQLDSAAVITGKSLKSQMENGVMRAVAVIQTRENIGVAVDIDTAISTQEPTPDN